MGAGLDEQRAAARMQVDVEVGPREEVVRHIAGDLLGGGAEVVAGEDPVQVQVVDGRGAPAGALCGGIEAGQQDQLALYIVRLQVAHEFGDHDGPFVLVTVDAAAEHHHRPAAVADRRGPERDHAPGEWGRNREPTWRPGWSQSISQNTVLAMDASLVVGVAGGHCRGTGRPAPAGAPTPPMPG